MEQVPEDLARWAVQDGLDHVSRATSLLDDGLDALAVGTRLRGSLTTGRAAFVVTAAVARRRAVAAGVPGAEQLVLTREAGEQASRPAVAAWRAAHVAASGGVDSLQDWCAGTGADAVALALHGPVTAVEQDPGRAVLARHRAAVLGVAVEVVVGDALTPTLDPSGAVVHADPDRRDVTGRRARTLAAHGPSVAALHTAMSTAAGTAVVVAPGTAWDDPDLPEDAEVAFLEDAGQLVEAVLLRRSLREGGVRARAVLVDHDLTLTRSDDPPAAPVVDVGEWLVRPGVALVRARLHDQLALDVDGGRLGRHTSLLTCDAAPVPTPWLRAERVLAVVAARPRAVRDLLRAHTGREVELVLHGVRVDPATFLRGAGRPPTGPGDLRIHLVRRDDDAVAVLTTVRADPPTRGGTPGTAAPER